jgi:hypothetical protein
MNRNSSQWPELFHGTSAAIPTGGNVEASRDKMAKSNAAPLAFATTDQKHAERVAAGKASESGHLFGVVYGVDRLDDSNTSLGTTVASKKGFKVTGVKKWVDNADLAKGKK